MVPSPTELLSERFTSPSEKIPVLNASCNVVHFSRRSLSPRVNAVIDANFI